MDFETITRELIQQNEQHRLVAFGSEHSDEFIAIQRAATEGNTAAGEALALLQNLRKSTAPATPHRPEIPQKLHPVIAQGVKLQKQLPWLNLVAVGGTAAALHAHHRLSVDVDFVALNLSENFDRILDTVQEWTEWKTTRITAPVMILGESNHIELGLRQSFRKTPFQTVEFAGLRIPTLEECFQIKSYLLVKRRATRDFVDTCALLDMLALDRAATLLANVDNDFPPIDKLGHTAKFAESIRRGPDDREGVDLAKFKDVISPYNNWEYVHGQLRKLSLRLVVKDLTQRLPKPPEPPKTLQ